MKPVIFLMGPTASGKTDLAVELVQSFPFEIVSVDSAMVYRGMDIGSAKPEDFRKATQRVYRAAAAASAISFEVLPPSGD